MRKTELELLKGLKRRTRRSFLQGLLFGVGACLTGSVMGHLYRDEIIEVVTGKEEGPKTAFNIKEHPYQVHRYGQFREANPGNSRSLERFLTNAKEDRISRDESIYNLETGRVKMKGFGSHASGILISEDGFVLTAYHVIKDHEEHWKAINEGKDFPSPKWFRNELYGIVDARGKYYPLDLSFWAANPALDIALVKVQMPGRPVPRRIRVASEDLKEGEPVICLPEGKRDRQFGRVRRETLDLPFPMEGPDATIYDSFTTSAIVLPGYSGGPIATLEEGKLAGLASYSTGSELYRSIGNSGGSKSRNLLTLIAEAVKKLRGQ